MAYEASEEKTEKLKLSDDALLSILKGERQASIGFENGTELSKKRRQSLEYSKGEMKDVPSLPNRSKAVSSDVIDAIETVLPDLMEIFTSGEDVASFDPTGEEDEKGAKQETEYVTYVAFRKMRGWRLLYTAIKDALQVDTGIIETWWADEEKTDEQKFEGITAVQLQMIEQDGYQITATEPLGVGPDGLESFNVTAEMTYDNGCIKGANIDPSNLSVAPDTVDIQDATYCVVRSYPRAQSLIDQGFDEELIEELPDYNGQGDEQTEYSRDLADEHTGANAGSNKALRTVEVHKHWLRVDADGDGKTELWCIHTDRDCVTLLDKRKVNRIGLAVGTPFLNTHRFYGQSLAEKLTEIQKIKTALVRMMLDSGYFALNQRTEVSEDKANEHTIADLLRNEPNVPVRSRTGDAVRPLQAGALGFDVQMALEYVSTMAESRSGVVRNAQGLNPDTLHDTAKGAQALMSMAQKRIRMIARVLSETLVKDWYLNIHHLSRTHNTRAEKVRLSGGWVDVDPSQFGDRADMTIEVGVGSGGREHEMAVMTQLLDFQKQIVELQGGLAGPLVTAQNPYELLKRMTERAGFKNPELYWTDPQKAPPQEPKPDPEMAKVEQQGKLKEAELQQTSQHKQAEMAMTTQAKQAELSMKQQADAAKADTDLRINAAKLQNELQLARERAAQELQLARERMAQEAQLQREQMALNHQAAMHQAQVKAATDTEISKNRPGGRLDQ